MKKELDIRTIIRGNKADQGIFYAANANKMGFTIYISRIPFS